MALKWTPGNLRMDPPSGAFWNPKEPWKSKKAPDPFTKSSFWGCTLHIEWASPSVVEGSGQGRGNSGVYLQGRYEIQVLDSFNNETYFNGQAGSFYGHAAPLVNASRPPGQWQSYDIIFISPKPQADGSGEAGSFTVLHNGVLIQHQTPIHGGATTAAEFKGVAPKGLWFFRITVIPSAIGTSGFAN